jgi:hypothetical protein
MRFIQMVHGCIAICWSRSNVVKDMRLAVGLSHRLESTKVH